MTVPNTFIHCTLTTRLAFAIFQLPYFSNALFLFNCNLITPTCCKSMVSTSAVPQLNQSQHPDLLQHLFPYLISVLYFLYFSPQWLPSACYTLLYLDQLYFWLADTNQSLVFKSKRPISFDQSR